MSVALVANQDGIAATRRLQRALEGFSYKAGERYAEFRSGDKMAGYGLAALIGGGAAAAAVKTGILQKWWKLLVGLASRPSRPSRSCSAARLARSPRPPSSRRRFRDRRLHRGRLDRLRRRPVRRRRARAWTFRGRRGAMRASADPDLTLSAGFALMRLPVLPWQAACAARGIELPEADVLD